MVPTADGRIRNDDGIGLLITPLDADKLEGNSGSTPFTPFTFRVTRLGSDTDLAVTTTVNYVTSGSGTDPANTQDFAGNLFPTGTVTFANGVRTQDVIIPVNGDTTAENNESFTVTLSNASGGAKIVTPAADGRIRNDDPIGLLIAPLNADKPEGNSGSNPSTAFTFRVTRLGSETDLAATTTVNYATSGSGTDAANTQDFAGNLFPTGTVTFASGVRTQDVTIPVQGDTTPENDEGFTVTLSNASGSATIATPSADGRIRNDDGIGLLIAPLDADKLEGNSGANPSTSFTFRVTRVGSETELAVTTTVNYVTTGSGADQANAQDFVGNAFPGGTVTFANGVRTQDVIIPVHGDTTAENNESFTVTLSNASGGAKIVTPAADGRIRNDDPIGLLIAPLDADKPEGNSGSNPSTAFTFRVTRLGSETDLAVTTTVNYVTTGSGTDQANAQDFVGNVFPTGTVTFASGVRTQDVTIPVNGDTTPENDEGFTITLSNASGGATVVTRLPTGEFGTTMESPCPSHLSMR